MSRRSTPLTVVVGGMIAGVPRQGGATWAVLQYLLGLRRLGHKVLFVETVRREELRPRGTALADSVNARYTADVMDRFGLGSAWALMLPDLSEVAGLPYSDVVAAVGQAEVLFNLAGAFTHELVFDPVPVRVYVDLDPGFTQIWHDRHDIDMAFDMHNVFVTVGQAIGRPECPIPLCGRHWITTVPPVVLDTWVPTPITTDRWTTVANWRSYGSVQHEGTFYGQKAHSWREILRLPAVTGGEFEVALAIDPGDSADIAALETNGWTLVEPRAVTATPEAYHHYVRTSKAEFSVAKGGYVRSRGAWFSDRSACYLASGRPVVAQETGFSRFIPTGEGLHSFSNLDDAREAVSLVNESYGRQSRASRRLAEDVFDSDKVLASILDQVGATG